MKRAEYQIILLRNNECIQTFSSFSVLENALKRFNDLLEENKKVIFPIKYLNQEKIESVRYKLCLIKRKDDSDLPITRLKNDFGEYVDHIIDDNDEWVIRDMENYYFEENFWVYGYNPRYIRKDFLFIYDDLLKGKTKNKYNFTNILVYKNKILFDRLEDSDLIICKNSDDAYRLYCLLDDFCKNDKLKNVMFGGNGARNRKNSITTMDKIQKLTHWSRKKIGRNTT